MSLGLIIDTACERGILLLIEDGCVLESRYLTAVMAKHSKIIFSEIQKLLHSTSIQDVDWIAVGIGPGSYTGTRVAVSIALSCAYVLDIPMISFDSLLLFQPEEEALVAVDARQGGIYFRSTTDRVEAKSQLISVELFLDILEKRQCPVYTPSLSAFEKKSSFLGGEMWVEASVNGDKIASIVQKMYENKKFTNLFRKMEINYLRNTYAEHRLDLKGDV